MKLYIAEKHSVGTAIARALNGPAEKRGNCIECPNGIVVTWLAGHLLRLAEPEEYDATRWKRWTLSSLPCIPEQFKKLPPKKDHKKAANRSLRQLEAVLGLIGRATSVVHAGDPDREGQLIVDEVLAYAGYAGPVRRILPNSTTPAAIAKALADERDNAAYRGLLLAALGRQQADWLIGLNCTRAMTVAAHDGRLLNVGRVKTPTLWLVVKRCREIANFEARPYYELAVDVRTASGEILTLHREAVDESARLWDRAAAEALAAAIRGQAVSLKVAVTSEQEPSPMPYRLRDFQMDANREHRWKAVEALAVLQKLYGAGLLTYPRTDIAHLRDEEAGRVPHILKAIGTSGLVQEFAVFRRVPGVPVISKRVFDSSKVREHHGIIPTDLAPRALDKDADRIAYAMVARRLLMALMPPRRYERTKVDARLARLPFTAVGQRTTDPGWRVLKPLRDPEVPVPPVKDGERAQVLAVRVEKKMTVAPEYYTEASLLADMNGVHKYVDDPALKARLKETSGIGTPATQAETIAELQANGFILAQGNRLVATQLGADLIDNVPQLLANPAYTALMEEALEHVQERRVDLAAFKASAAQLTERLVEEIKSREGRMKFELAPAPTAQSRGRLTGKKRKWKSRGGREGWLPA